MIRCRPLPFAVVVALVVAIASSSHSAPAAAPERTDNAVLHVVRTGHGPALVFIPGLTCSGAVYDAAVAHYAARYTCHVVTLGGFAGQPRFDGPFLGSARDSLLAYVRAQRLDHPVVVGHSLGGTLALEMAIEQPDAFRGFVILDALPFYSAAGDSSATEASARAAMRPMCDMIRKQPLEQFQAFQRNSPYVPALVTGEADRARVRQWGADSDPVATADAMFDIATTDLRGPIAGITAPVLVLGSWYGMKDMTTPARVDSLYRAQYARAPHFQFALADSARHFVMLDAPEWTWRRIDAFLAGLPAPMDAKGRGH
jgi:N-formylmaleamate deformylase